MKNLFAKTFGKKSCHAAANSCARSCKRQATVLKILLRFLHGSCYATAIFFPCPQRHHATPLQVLLRFPTYVTHPHATLSHVPAHPFKYVRHAAANFPVRICRCHPAARSLAHHAALKVPLLFLTGVIIATI